MDSLDEELLALLCMPPVIWRVPLPLIKWVPAEEHGVEHHTTGPYICRTAFIALVLPHIAQNFGCCEETDPLVRNDTVSNSSHCQAAVTVNHAQKTWMHAPEQISHEPPIHR